MADPVIDNIAGTATINFDSTTNHTLSKATCDSAFGSGSLILVPQNYVTNGWEKFDATPLDTSNVWKTNNLTVISTDQGYIGAANYEIESSPSDSDILKTRALLGTTQQRRVGVFWFWDDGSTNGGTEYYFTCQATAAGDTAYGILAIGWDTDGAAPNKYVYRLAGGAAVDSGITRTQGWHKVVLQTDFAATDEESFHTRKIFIDATQVYSESTTIPTGDPVPFATSWRSWSWNAIDAGTPEYHVDELVLQEGSGNIFEEGTDQIDIQPNNVDSFDSVTIDDDTTGAWKGTLTYQFQYSSNGGSSFGSLTTLNDANLAALSPVGGGQDVLRIKITLTPDTTTGINQAYFPRVNQIVVNFTPNPFVPRLALLGVG